MIPKGHALLKDIRRLGAPGTWESPLLSVLQRLQVSDRKSMAEQISAGHLRCYMAYDSDDRNLHPTAKAMIIFKGGAGQHPALPRPSIEIVLLLADRTSRDNSKYIMPSVRKVVKAARKLGAGIIHTTVPGDRPGTFRVFEAMDFRPVKTFLENNVIKTLMALEITPPPEPRPLAGRPKKQEEEEANLCPSRYLPSR